MRRRILLCGVIGGYHLFIFEWGSFESGQKLYKGFSISIIEYLNYLGGWALNSEYTTYLACLCVITNLYLFLSFRLLYVLAEEKEINMS